MRDDWEMPIYKALEQYAEEGPLPFHMPGHKLGRGFPKEFLLRLASLDVTEIPGTDDLHDPHGAIKESQILAAKAFGAEESLFLVNGSTAGIHGAILTLCREGDGLIIGRDCHKSVINGLLLAGAVPIPIQPDFSEEFGIPTAITPQSVEKTLREYPDAKGVLLTRPGYHGICADVEAIAEVVHANGKALIVDEAHGAHLCFHRELPVSALEGGADLCIQSAHKTLAAFTQGAYLHIRGNRVDRRLLKEHLRLLQTSSPSYMVMASLDFARAQMEYNGEKLLASLMEHISEFKRGLLQIDGFTVLDEVGSGRAFDRCLRHDPTRVVIRVAGAGLTGFEAAKALRKGFAVQVEMADLCNIVLIATVADGGEQFQRLLEAMKGLASYGRGRGQKVSNLSHQPLIRRFAAMEPPEKKLGLAQAFYGPGQLIPLRSGAGRISKSMLVPYPPGIPVIFPGEVISLQMVEAISLQLEAGGVVHGVDDGGRINVNV